MDLGCRLEQLAAGRHNRLAQILQLVGQGFQSGRIVFGLEQPSGQLFVGFVPFQPSPKGFLPFHGARSARKVGGYHPVIPVALTSVSDVKNKRSLHAGRIVLHQHQSCNANLMRTWRDEDSGWAVVAPPSRLETRIPWPPFGRLVGFSAETRRASPPAKSALQYTIAIKPMLLLIRLACAAYWSALTVLLLAPEPTKLLGLEPKTVASIDRGSHFVFFLTLALLVVASRGPIRRNFVALALVAYAFVTEGLQWFVPTRHVDPVDLLENLLGLAAGVLLWHTLQRVIGRLRGCRSPSDD